MMIDRAALHVYDMAAEWREHTGLPFFLLFGLCVPMLLTTSRSRFSGRQRGRTGLSVKTRS